jgi:deoxyadenosine/deoxycytidine kinase
VAVAGNIGSGKTTLTGLLSRKLGWQACYEKASENPYLADFYKDMKRWSFNLQVYILVNRFQNYQDIHRRSASCIQDRSIYEDAEIFAHLLYKRGCMDDRDYKNYRSLFSVLTANLQKPDLIIYLKTPAEKLLRHIRERGRSYEGKIDLAYLQELNDSYDRWVEHARNNNFNIYTYNMANRDFKGNKKDFRIIYELIHDMEKRL